MTPGKRRRGRWRELCRAADQRSPRAAGRGLVTMRAALRGRPSRPPCKTRTHRRLLDVDIPAQPDVLVQLSLLLAEDEVDFNAASLLISSDMALAAAVLKAVNSAMYGLRGRVQSVQQAITYLGTREVASVTFEMGLRAVFPDCARARAALGPGARARPADGPDRRDARRRLVGRALGRAVRGMRQGGDVPPRHRAATSRCSPKPRPTKSC